MDFKIKAFQGLEKCGHFMFYYVKFDFANLVSVLPYSNKSIKETLGFSVGF